MSARDFFPPGDKPTLAKLRSAAAACQGCELFKDATQTVFGAGAAKALVMLVGEQPGDREDVQGHPFVGPAGLLLDRALAEAGMDRSKVYVTNVVKHFRWTPAPRGKRRMHAKPSAQQIRACRPWLEQELLVVKPKVVVLLGATAAQALMGSAFRVTRERGKPLTGTALAQFVVATVHPSAILRAPDDAERKRQYAAFVEDLRAAARTALS